MKKKITPSKSPLSVTSVETFTKQLFDDDLHAKRIISLANTTIGILQSSVLGIHAIGNGLAAAKGLVDKHAIKQVDRLVGNQGVDIWELFSVWVPYVIGNRWKIRLNMDWTDFDPDDHTMLVISLQTPHSRSIPLVWTTVQKSTLKGQRNDYEDQLLRRLRELISREVHVTIVADRGFADHKLYAFLKDELQFEYVIRFRSVIHVTDALGETRPAKDWLGQNGRMRVLRNASVTSSYYPVATVVCVQEKGMKDAWCIVASDSLAKGPEIKRCYSKRFTCEEMFRDIKDLRYGMGMAWYKIRRTDRRDRLFFAAMLAYMLLLLLGEAGERAGLDRLLKANTSLKRTLSLFRQGLRWYELIPNMPPERLQILIENYELILIEQRSLCNLLDMF